MDTLTTGPLDKADASVSRPLPTGDAPRRTLTQRLGHALLLSCVVLGAAGAGCTNLLGWGGDDDSETDGGDDTGSLDSGCSDNLEFFKANLWDPIMSSKCTVCHTETGLAKGTRLVLDTSGTDEALQANFEAVRNIAAIEVNGESTLLLRPSGRHPDGHAGGALIPFQGDDYVVFEKFVNRVNLGVGCDQQPTACEPDMVSGRRVLRRMSRVEFDRTVADLLGVDTTGYILPTDANVEGFDNNADALLYAGTDVQLMRDAAEDIAARVIEAPGSLVPCEIATGDDACATEFFERFGRRAFRRALTQEDRARYMELYRSVKADEGFAGAVQAMIAAALQSPYFLYRPEIGAVAADGTYQLLPHEIASQLSYMIWSSMPDDELLSKAESGELATPAAISAEVDRMLQDPRADAGILRFFKTWLQLSAKPSKDMGAYPEYTEAVRQAIEKETAAFVRHLIREGSGSLSEMYTANYSYVNQELASFYGLPAPDGAPDQDGMARVDLTGSNRMGILTLGSVLSTHAHAAESSPVHRGKFVREQLLCQPLPPPPAGLDVKPPQPDPTKSTRERFFEHSNNDACGSCHSLIDGIGFGFEHFDGVGRYRDSDDGHPVDASGNIVGAEGTNGTFDGTGELAQKLAQSPDAQACFTLQWLRFGFGAMDQAELSCMAEQITGQLGPENLTVAGVIKAIAQSPRFTRRLAEAVTESGPDTDPGDEQPSGTDNDPPPTNGDFDVVEKVDSVWGGGGCKSVTVTNMGEARAAWAVTLQVDGTPSDVWNAKHEVGNAGVTFTGVDWNAELERGASAGFGFCWRE
ncbi:DUF1592 domain-containing protein [Sorangium sp. So ce1335]|uniref:DUF1592 domain-containing protein n=1 Tax=Sorangium sp. So ce1335 TaxID=3133335 RepID=UPI003F5FAA5E